MTMTDVVQADTTMIGAGVVLGGLILRTLAYRFWLDAWNRHEERKSALGPEKVALLTPPPEIPASILKLFAAVLLLGALTAALGLVMRGREPAVACPDPRALTGGQSGEPFSADLFAQTCTEHKQCGPNCACKDGQCRCPAFSSPVRQPQPAPPGPADGGTAPKSKQSGPPYMEPTSGLAAKGIRHMAGDPSFAGSL